MQVRERNETPDPIDSSHVNFDNVKAERAVYDAGPSTMMTLKQESQTTNQTRARDGSLTIRDGMSINVKEGGLSLMTPIPAPK